MNKTLKRCRKARKLSQKTLADILGVTYQQVQKYESGANRVPSDKVNKICETLNITPNDLFSTGSGIVPTKEERELIQMLRACDEDAFKALTNIVKLFDPVQSVIQIDIDAIHKKDKK